MVKESALECACMNNDNFTVLVSTVDAVEWACVLCGFHIQNDWVSRAMNLHPNLQLSCNIPLQKLFGWFSRPQLWATGDWQLHHDNVPASALHLVQRFSVKYPITQVAQPHYSLDLVPCDLGNTSSLSQNLNHLWKGRDFRLLMRFRKIQQGGWWWLGELCEVPRCLLWRELRPRDLCTMFIVSCIFFNKCLYFSYYVAGYLLGRPHMF